MEFSYNPHYFDHFLLIFQCYILNFSSKKDSDKKKSDDDEDKDDSGDDEEKLKKARQWDDWKDSKFS